MCKKKSYVQTLLNTPINLVEYKTKQTNAGLFLLKKRTVESDAPPQDLTCDTGRWISLRVYNIVIF